VAALLHAHSARAKQPLVVFNSARSRTTRRGAAVGHTKGAFTGAVASQIRLLRAGEPRHARPRRSRRAAARVQAKLLRALQEHEIQPLGSPRVEKVDVRVIAATHAIWSRRSRPTVPEDLYYRLNVVELVVPPLRAHV